MAGVQTQGSRHGPGQGGRSGRAPCSLDSQRTRAVRLPASGLPAPAAACLGMRRHSRHSNELPAAVAAAPGLLPRQRAQPDRLPGRQLFQADRQGAAQTGRPHDAAPVGDAPGPVLVIARPGRCALRGLFRCQPRRRLHKAPLVPTVQAGGPGAAAEGCDLNRHPATAARTGYARHRSPSPAHTPPARMCAVMGVPPPP